MAQERPPAVTTDVVVVGSGPAGAAMALALALSTTLDRALSRT